MVQRYIKNAMKRPKVSVNPPDLLTKVQSKAYELYEKRGCSHGNDWSDWFEAERQVKRGLNIR